MRIAYLTIDEVNQELALQAAGTSGVTLHPLWPVELPGVDGQYDAFIIDLDYLPGPLRQKILTNLLSGAAPRPVAVHSFNLEDEQVANLRKNGVAVSRHFEPGFFETLRRTDRQGRAAV